jgi:hypothetical protein
MRKGLLLASCVLSGLLVVGCDSKSEESSTPATPATPQSTGNAVSDGVKNATGAVGDAAKNAQNTVSNAAASATDTAKQKLQQVTDYINQKKFDVADTTLGEVEKVKSSLPQDLQDQVTALRTKLDAAKAAAK